MLLLSLEGLWPYDKTSFMGNAPNCTHYSAELAEANADNDLWSQHIHTTKFDISRLQIDGTAL